MTALLQRRGMKTFSRKERQGNTTGYFFFSPLRSLRDYCVSVFVCTALFGSDAFSSGVEGWYYSVSVVSWIGR